MCDCWFGLLVCVFAGVFCVVVSVFLWILPAVMVSCLKGGRN